jgi:Permuted papain-like amidase enzyme, YaeF/YiiX, C92 family
LPPLKPEGRPYDIRYELDDEKIYCSELIYKAFRTATGEELGKLQRLGDLDWRPYRETIEAIENGPAPLDRLMITPRSLSEAAQLMLVAESVR